jgi:hypothetical protein
MNNITDSSVIIQTSAESVPSTPFLVWRSRADGRVSSQTRCPNPDQRACTLCAASFRVLRGHRFSRGALRLCHQRGTHPGSGSRERLQPFAVPFMALFDRDQRRARSTLSRFLAALTEAPVEALRTLFLDDLRETAHSRTTQMRSKPGVWWIEQETPGWSLTSMARVRAPA